MMTMIVTISLSTPTESVGVGKMLEFVCLFMCVEHNSKTKDPEVFKLGVGNDIS